MRKSFSKTIPWIISYNFLCWALYGGFMDYQTCLMDKSTITFTPRWIKLNSCTLLICNVRIFNRKEEEPWFKEVLFKLTLSYSWGTSHWVKFFWENKTAVDFKQLGYTVMKIVVFIGIIAQVWAVGEYIGF